MTAQLDSGPAVPERSWTGTLEDPRCRDPRSTVRPVAVIARGDRHFTVPEALVIVLPVGSCLDTVAAEAAAALDGVGGRVTVRGWLGDEHGNAQALPPYWHNLDPVAAQESVVELAALGARSHEAGRHDRVVVLCQRFVPTSAAARVVVDSTARQVRVDSCWGLDEMFDTVFATDTLILSLPALDIVRHTVVQKPNAVRAADGGTAMVSVAPDRRGRAAVYPDLGRRLGTACRHLSLDAGSDGRFTIGIVGDRHYLLTCELDEL
ncbi:hypothetical protein [Actinoplanes sp. NPDC049316]|uniref:hypothetical protein n=1 Tax=Actinoplanes sp. NPDC049316 TaxID=3154727 RepID=UPI00341F8EEC